MPADLTSIDVFGPEPNVPASPLQQAVAELAATFRGALDKAVERVRIPDLAPAAWHRHVRFCQVGGYDASMSLPSYWSGPMALTAKQAAFAAEYCLDFNGAQAAIRAGYSAKTARAIASELLAKDEVAAAVAAAVSARTTRTEIEGDRVLQEAAHLAFAEISDAVAWGDAVAVKDAETGQVTIAQGIALVPSASLPPRMRAAISEVSQTKEGLKIKMHSKTAGLDLLFKHLGLAAPERREISGKNGGPIETKDLTPHERARKVAALVAEMQAQDPAK